MLMFRVRRGLRFNANDGRLWTIDRILISSRIVLIAEDGHVETLPKRELIRRWHRHEWLVDAASIRDVADTLFTATDRDLTAYTANQRAQAAYSSDREQSFHAMVNGARSRRLESGFLRQVFTIRQPSR